MDFDTGNFLRLSRDMLDSYYYRYVLNSNDKVMISAFFSSFLNKGTDPYSKGLLIVNIKQENLRKKTGSMTYSTCTRSLQNLCKLGIVIKLKKKYRNNRYLVGFRIENNNPLFLIYHLIDKYEQMVVENIENQQNEIKEFWKEPTIKDINPYCINSLTKDFIIEHIDDNNLFDRRNQEGKTLFEVLFNRNDYYKFRFSKLIGNATIPVL